VIFSAGNSGEYESQVSYPARIPACFAVGAIDTFDVRFPYSQYAADSPEVDIVTYSSVLGMQSDFWSIDQMGEFGANVAYKNPRFPDYLWDCGPEGNDLDYNCHFAGTSAACAVVAGAASLLIAKDSFLTAEEVYTILRGSAVRELAWNGGLPIDTPNNEYGYGRVDAFRAVLSISHGDVTNDGEIDMADITFLIDWIYRAGPTPFPSPDLGDIDCDGVATISDITKLISYVYIDGPPPVKPCFKYGLPAK
jgi:subtilisin family serine protease